MALQADGKIVTAGYTGQHPKFALARYDSDGALDPTFGTGGKVITKVGMWGIATDLAIQPDGRIVVVGFNGRGFALVRYRANGNLDTSFSEDGMLGTSIAHGFARAVVLQPNGRIVVAGDMDIFRVVVARYLPRGQLDETFSGDGWTIARFGSGEQAIDGLAMTPGGKIVGAGYVGPHEFGDAVEARFTLLRLRPDGVLDTTLAGDGKITTTFPGGAYGADLVREPSGRLIVAGTAGVFGPGDVALAAYEA